MNCLARPRAATKYSRSVVAARFQLSAVSFQP